MKHGNRDRGIPGQILLLLVLGALILGSCAYASDGDEIVGAENVTIGVTPTETVIPEPTEVPNVEVTPTETLNPEATATPLDLNTTPVSKTPASTDNTLKFQSFYNGQQIDEREIGPGLPPPGWVKNANRPDLTETKMLALNAADVPVLDWSYGCSATSAAMYFGYYDRNGYPNMYTGPTGGGVFPLTNAVWGAGECPLSASHNGIDGRVIRGHADDYYSAYLSTVDPYFGNWAEHTDSDCVGDYMGTNQYQHWTNLDGSTTFYFYTLGAKLNDFTGYESSSPPKRDGAHGIKLFVESRGYTVSENFNQYIYGYNGNTQGFTYAQYKAEIDANNPVLIQLDGHTMLGVGYSGLDQIIVHDTWDYVTHTMTWGGSYSGMAHQGVTVIKLNTPPLPAVNFTANITSGSTPLAVKFTDTSAATSPTQWAWTFGDGEEFTTTSSAQRSPTHIYFRPGNYTVNLTVTHAGGTTTASKPLYINVSRSTSPTRPPENATKLIFIHHSCGQHWLEDANGGLGTSLKNNNYFVSDTNYNWGPSAIGDHTDIGDWWSWFRGPSSTLYLADLYNESGQHSTYTRIATDPGGPNEIVMFKSCFPNSDLHGNPSDPIPSIEDNPLRGQSCGSEDHSVANAKGIYTDLLEYFSGKPDTLFIVVTAPPLTSGAISSPETPANARALNQWLVNDWLDDYPVGNVFVFDFYNVLTTNKGNINTNDLGQANGNHHRWWSDAVQHQVDSLASNTSAYGTTVSDSHPTAAGNRKATGEYVPLLNYAYNWWVDNRTPYDVDFSANVTTGYLPLWIQFTDSSTVVSPIHWNWSFGDGQVFGTAVAGQKDPVHVFTTAGTYAVRLDVTNATGTHTRIKNAYITASPITANFTANATFGTVRMPVLFTDSSTGSPTAWNWSFGDGRYSTVQNPLHMYNSSGNFTVTLNASNAYSMDTFTRTNYINVNPAARPQITAVTPATAILNTTINVTITGKYFQTRAFETWVNFTYNTGGQTFDNRNITVTSVTPTRINATMIVGPGMPAGKWNLTVTTVDGGPSAKKLSAITVSHFPVPKVTSISPVSGYQNSTLTYTIFGTNFIPGQTTVYFTNKTGSMLNVTALTSVTTTRINGTLVIPQNAPLGAWNLDVATVDSGGNGTKLGAFTVNKVLAPTMGALTPSSGSRNTTTAFTLTGTNFQTGEGKTSVHVYEDVMDTDLPVTITGVTTTKITGTITAAAGASPGSYIVEVTTVDGGTVTRAGGFRIVQAAIPAISSMTPSGGYRNGTVAYTVTGTGFQPEKTTIVLKNQTTGAVLGTMTADSVTATKIQGNLTIPVAAPTGYYRLDVTTVDGGVVNRINAFRVDAVKAPVMGSITPTTGSKNTTVAFTLTGANFQTDPGQTSVAIVDDTSGTNLAATIYSVTSTKIIGSFTIPAGTPAGKYRLELATTDGGTVTKADAFTVNYLPLPTITSLLPASGNRGSTVQFTLKGRDFLDGGTFVNLRAPGNAINGVISSVNSTTIIGNFTIPGAAATGSYRLDVYTVGGGINSRTNAFTVK
ncbi:MAG TPA: PKD domain-containing protein [Methanoregula sp.]|nr:PKD domain-containing protein [Methanoregula sp.]